MALKSFNSIILISAVLLQTNFALAQNSCRSLILRLTPRSQNETVVNSTRRQDHAPEAIAERRSPVRTWKAIENLGARVISTRYSFMPENMNLSVYRDGESAHLVAETVVKLNSTYKLQQNHLPIDWILPVSAENIKSESVINAGLETGRQFLNKFFFTPQQLRQRSQNAAGVYLFVDVNNLGWINKNFSGQKNTGDLYIQSVTRVLQKHAKEKGLIFRLGGDEFALLLEPMTTAELQKLMTDISADVKKDVHFIFREESIKRAEAFRIVHQDFKNGRISEQQYNEALADFKKYTAYSQEGVSLGASYVDGRSAEQVQKSAEDMALQMKLAVKMSHQQDVTKYTGQTILFEGPPKLNYVHEVPKLDFTLQTAKAIGLRNVQIPKLPVIEMQRQQVLKRLGNLNIVKFVSETGESQVFAEYFDSSSALRATEAQPMRVEKIEISHTTEMIDMRDNFSQKVLDALLKSEQQKTFIWVNLLNLGKLNYFEHKTLTGDKALKRVAQVIRSVLRDNDLPFKLAGSEFLIYLNHLDSTQAQQVRTRLQTALSRDAELLSLYADQVKFLQKKLEVETNSVEQQKIKEAIEEVRMLIQQERFSLRDVPVVSTTGVDQFLNVNLAEAIRN